MKIKVAKADANMKFYIVALDNMQIIQKMIINAN